MVALQGEGGRERKGGVQSGVPVWGTWYLVKTGGGAWPGGAHAGGLI